MSDYTWNADAFDAIRIVAANGEFVIEGGDTDEILLEGEEHRRFGSAPSIAGRWLEFQPFGGGGDWNLTLPKSKAWVIELMSGSGEVNIQNLHARLTVQMGSGEIHIEDCRGVFNVRSGNGDVEIENCVQTDAPAAPERVAQEERAEANSVPPPPGVPPIPPIPPVPPIGVKVKVGKGVRFDSTDDWEAYGHQWEEWGERFSDEAARWAENLSRNFAVRFDTGDDSARGDGFHVQLGHGDIQMEEIDAQLVTARLASGDIHIDQGRIADLQAKSSQGDVQVEGVLPAGAWELTTRHGDIQLVLPGDAYVRLDAATRHGDISCDAPLVRVGRPGPGARHGGRMVGTIGEGTGDPVDVHLESQHGDIHIDVERRPSRYAGQAARPQDAARETTPSKEQQVNSTESRERQGEPSAAPVTESGAASNPPPQGREQNYDSQFAVLQALQAGEISVAEAEALLRSLQN